jgi:FkbH-like protein
MDTIASYIGKKHIYDPRMNILASSPFSSEMHKAVASEVAIYCTQIAKSPLKCMILDLDNTLWGGIVGEDGIEGIKLDDFGIGKAYKDFQTQIQRLATQGVLLAVCSKNNYNDAIEVFEKHPHMVIKTEMLSSTHINWNNKEENIRTIASELNIGLDSMLFIDDSPMERAAIAALLPQVEILDLPTDPVYYSDTLCRYPRFAPLQLTEEDTTKNVFFIQNRQRKEDEKRISDTTKFLRESDITVLISEAAVYDFPRLAQLYGKTNQFNLTTQRYSETDLRSFSSRADCSLWSMRVKDRYGDYGLAGSALVIADSIDSFILSCRAFGRSVELALLSHLTSHHRNSGGTVLFGRRVPSEKNMMTANFYRDAGFSHFENRPQEVIWALPKEHPLPEFPEWITISKGDDH